MSDVVGDVGVSEPAQKAKEKPEPERDMVIPPDLAERDYVTTALCFGTAEERAHAGWVRFDKDTALKSMTAWELAQILRIVIELPMHLAKAVMDDEKVARHFKVMK